MLKKYLLACALAALVPAAALASDGARIAGIGPRLGISSNPDQVVFGGQLQTGEFAPHVTFDPSVEFGFGDNVTTVGFNFDFKYSFEVRNSDWTPYAGFGIGVAVFSFDQPPPLRDVSNTETGGNAILGVSVPTRNGSRFFTEARVGIGDLPDLKVLAGWNFPL
jgi:opacity protein-like surface antigen